MSENIVHIIKSTGVVVPFSIEKLQRSLRKSGADEATVSGLSAEVESCLHEGMTTRDIYKLAYKLLKRKHRQFASKYTLKRAIMDLGPTGYPFEKYLAEILKTIGYEVKLNQVVKGQCVNHEVDIQAENGKSINVIECKYHNSQGIHCDVKIPLYVNSRYLDLKQTLAKDGKEYKGWIATNTKFTNDAIQYGICAGLILLGWDYPQKGSLKDLVDEYKIYPVTCMSTISSKEKLQILDKGIVLCRDLVSAPAILSGIMITENRIGNIINEALSLCKMQDVN
jgi:ATP cone domain